MNPLAQIGILVLQTIGGLYLLVVVLRFLLQTARADFYNPLSQAIARMTTPVLLPLRRLIPGLFGLDLASVVLALVVQYLTITLSCLLLGVVSPIIVLLWSLIGIASMIAYIYLFCIVVMSVASWIAPYTQHPIVVLSAQLVRPLCAPVQRIIPPLGGIDISPVFVFMFINIVRVLIKSAAASTGLVSMLVPGMF